MRGGVGVEELHSSGLNREEEALNGSGGAGVVGLVRWDNKEETRGGVWLAAVLIWWC